LTLLSRTVSMGAKFSALSRAERRTLLVAAASLPLFGMGLRLLGLRRFQGWLSRGALGARQALSREEIVRVAALVNVAARYTIFPATCLTRSLLLGWMLRRKGVASQLRIGVRLTQHVLKAHAWIEYLGTPINDSPAVCDEFAPFAEIVPIGAFRTP
jgi:hypothetical protein